MNNENLVAADLLEERGFNGPANVLRSLSVWALLFSAPYEGEKIMGIYTSREEAEAAFAENFDDDDENYVVREIKLNEYVGW